MGFFGPAKFDADEAREVIERMCKILMVEREQLHHYVELERNRVPGANSVHHHLVTTIETLLVIEKNQRSKEHAAHLPRLEKAQEVQIIELEWVSKALERVQKDFRFEVPIQDKIRHLVNELEREYDELDRAA
jgi:hypothetical protein